jgi:hypothetical protein
MNKLKIVKSYEVKGNNSKKTEKNPHAKPQVHSFTVMLIIIPVKLVDSNSSTQGTHNKTL